MTSFLLATDSVHTTAAACDYLAGRLTDGDSVIVLTVESAGADRRDGADAANVASVRLAEATVTTERRTGDVAAAILDLAAERDVDELVLGARRGAPDATAELGATARAVLASADRPVVVVPLPDL